MGVAELRRLVEERDKEVVRVEGLAAAAEARAVLAQEAVESANARAATLASELAEEARIKVDLQRRIDLYASRLEQLGIDPVALEAPQPDGDQKREQAAASAALTAQLRELNGKLQLSHETLQSNITRMTGILAQLNGGASDFQTLLEDEDDDDVPLTATTALDGADSDADEPGFGALSEENAA